MLKRAPRREDAARAAEIGLTRENRGMGRSALRENSGPVDESVRGLPAPPLRAYVAWYSGYRQRDVPPMTHRGLPSPYLTLILTLDDPLTLSAHPDRGQSPGDYRLLLGGLHTSPALVAHEGRQSGVQIALSPLGARVLLGLPAGELAGIDLHADEVLGPDIVEAHEALRQALDWPGRFAVLDAWLTYRADRLAASPVSPQVSHAWRLLQRVGGVIPVAAVADEVGRSTRRLSDRFAAEIGLSPKAAARVVRFDRARRALAARAMTVPPGGLRLAELAADCGYFDQAHLDREFRALAGCPPLRWVAEEFRNIQSGAHLGA
jgi:AraC-like DNA-binding protein